MGEGIIVLILFVIGMAVLGSILRAGARTGVAAVKTATGRGSFSENLASQFYTMGAFEIRIVESTLGRDDEGPQVKEIQGRGLLPVRQRTNAALITSVFDVTGEDMQPVLSHVEQFQESATIVFQQISDLGAVELNHGLSSWARIGGVIPEILHPPVGGNRNIKVVTRLVDLDNMPNIQFGFVDKPDLSLWTGELQFSYFFEGKGYEEKSEERDEAHAISIKIGMAVAMADGSLDNREGEILKKWIVKAISPFSETKRIRLKSVYNDAMRDSYDRALQGDLNIASLTGRLNKIGEKSYKYDAVELCFDIMVADGVADPEELKIIRQIAEALELDFDEIEKLRDQKIINLDTSIVDQASIEEIIGIEAEWSNGQINKHLRTEFKKWNDRLNTLSEGQERENAQRMLDLISEARSKYAR